MRSALTAILFLLVPAAWCACENPSTLPDDSWASVDFDRDSQPDFVHARRDYTAGAGCRYSVEVRLTGTKAVSRFDITIAPGGIRLRPRDVDGDGSVDLVVSQPFLRNRGTVFLNDGQGGFSPAPSSYTPSNIPAGPQVTAQFDPTRVSLSLCDTTQSSGSPNVGATGTALVSAPLCRTAQHASYCVKTSKDLFIRPPPVLL